MQSVSIKDVAREAGVSLGTVSNVLNRPELVRPATRAQVERVIAALGYVRNDSARQLRAGDSRTIAFLVPDAANPFFTDISRGMDALARERGMVVYLCDSNQDADRENDYLEQLLQQRVKGICITPIDTANPRLRTIVARGIPVIMVDHSPIGQEAQWCSVGVDDVLGGELAATHLIERGHDLLAYAGAARGIRQSLDRLAGVRRASEEAGRADGVTVLGTDGLSVADGRQAGARLLGLPRRRRPTAVVCGNDLIALGLLQQMTRHGVRVPGEVALIGYDDIDFAAAAAVPLTSVMQPRALLGRTAAELLIEEARANGTHEHRHVRYAPELVVRESSGG